MGVALEVGQLSGHREGEQDNGALQGGRRVQRVVDKPGDVRAEGPVVAAVFVQVEDRHGAVTEPAAWPEQLA